MGDGWRVMGVFGGLCFPLVGLLERLEREYSLEVLNVSYWLMHAIVTLYSKNGY